MWNLFLESCVFVDFWVLCFKDRDLDGAEVSSEVWVLGCLCLFVVLGGAW